MVERCCPNARNPHWKVSVQELDRNKDEYPVCIKTCSKKVCQSSPDTGNLRGLVAMGRLVKATRLCLTSQSDVMSFTCRSDQLVVTIKFWAPEIRENIYRRKVLAMTQATSCESMVVCVGGRGGIYVCMYVSMFTWLLQTSMRTYACL